MIGLLVVAACAIMMATMGRAVSLLAIALALSYVLWLRLPRAPRPSRIVPLYAAAVLVQCAHLLEEYRAGFHRALPPLFGTEPWSDRRFLVFNIVWLAIFVAAGVALTREKRIACLVALFLALGGGIGNGVAHLALVVREGGYFPGAYTAVLALLVGTLLARRLLRAVDRTAAA